MPDYGPILTSLQNPHVKYARSLHVRKHRYRERAFLTEGVRLVHDALEAGMTPDRVFVDESRVDPSLAASLERLDQANVPVHPVDAHVLDAMADTQTPQGIVAIFGFPELAIEPRHEQALLLLVDGIKDPGNLGTLMRAALGSGVHAMFLSPETVDPFSPKVVRSAMGAHFRLPTRSFRWDNQPEILSSGAQRLAADASGEIAYDRVDWTKGSVLVVGSETAGISEQARNFAPDRVSIPLRGGLESLNAAVAGAVILFEAARQRRTQ